MVALSVVTIMQGAHEGRPYGWRSDAILNKDIGSRVIDILSDWPFRCDMCNIHTHLLTGRAVVLWLGFN